MSTIKPSISNGPSVKKNIQKMRTSTGNKGNPIVLPNNSVGPKRVSKLPFIPGYGTELRNLPGRPSATAGISDRQYSPAYKASIKRLAEKIAQNHIPPLTYHYVDKPKYLIIKTKKK